MVYVYPFPGNFESRYRMIFLVCYKVDMFFLVWTKVEKTRSIKFVLTYLPETPLQLTRKENADTRQGCPRLRMQVKYICHLLVSVY